ncbi:hypothetical protein DFS34DRAFT_590043 [Phlyctochytrium arcticum]|nr:hypothetical protein DFS34DRAFT_590043 [Phlyctochytrium arcticum]
MSIKSPAGAGEVGDLLNNHNPANAGRDRLRMLSASGFFPVEDANPQLCRPMPSLSPSLGHGKEKDFWLSRFFQAATEFGISAGAAAQEIVWQRGTMHHLGEAFHSVIGGPSNGTEQTGGLPNTDSLIANTTDKNAIPRPTEMHFIPDANHDNLLPTQLLTTLQHTLGTYPTSKIPKVRRLNIDFVLSSRLARTTVHALSIGKVGGEGLFRGVAATRGAWDRFLSNICNSGDTSTIPAARHKAENLLKDMKSGTMLGCGLQAAWMLARIIILDFHWICEHEVKLCGY